MVYQNVEHYTKCSKCWHTIIFNIFLTCSTFLKRRCAKFNIFKCWFSYDISLNPCFKVVQSIVARSIPCLHIPSSYNIPYLKLNNQTFWKKVNFWLNIWYHSQHLVCTNMRVYYLSGKNPWRFKLYLNVYKNWLFRSLIEDCLEIRVAIYKSFKPFSKFCQVLGIWY